MKSAARSFFVGVFLCVYLFVFHIQIHAQDTTPSTTVVQATTAGDEDNPYLQKNPSVSPTRKPVSSISPAPTKSKGQVLAGNDTNTPELGTFTPGEPNWQVDSEVTQVGRNAERARELIYWVVTHPAIYKVGQIAQAWAFTRNVALILVVFVIIGLALQLVISSRSIGQTFSGISLGMERINLLSIIIRVTLILIFIFFSYIFVRGIIEVSDVTSQFFIEKLGGKDLFNVIYSDTANQEQNYSFVGYRNQDPLEQDMANTSLLLVRLTSFTYNFMSVIIILRQIILIFLLIASPFLALLLPFIFVRNTGTIWIGEFLRWLFYGPLFSLFLAALAKIWKAGIPYNFNFDRVKNNEMVYHTAINILYGGPAQTLSATNTSNYVDTYAEYVIGIIMLWVAILLPWLLLRIFRDYCCELIEKNGALLSQILDRMRNFTPPPPPAPAAPGPTSTFGKKIDLPFRQVISESKSTSRTSDITREKIIEKIHERDISNIDTREIQRAFDLRVSNIKDVARMETQKSSARAVKSTLDQISNPLKVSDSFNRQAFENLRSELTRRAASGDEVARSMIQAATYNVSQIQQVTNHVSNEALKEAVARPGVPVILPGIRIPTEQAITPAVTAQIAQKTNVPAQKVEQVLKAIPLAGGHTEEEKIARVAQKTSTSKENVKKIMDNMPEMPATTNPTGPAPVTIEEYEEVRKMWMKHYQNSDVPISENIKSRDDWIAEDIQKLTNTINLLTSTSVKDRQKGMENVAELLPFLLLGGFTDLETLSYIKAKLEAARLVMEEMEHVDKAREEAKENEEELVSIPVIEKPEEKTMDLNQSQTMTLPQDEEKKDDSESLPDFSDEDEILTVDRTKPDEKPDQSVDIPTNDGPQEEKKKE